MLVKKFFAVATNVGNISWADVLLQQIFHRCDRRDSRLDLAADLIARAFLGGTAVAPYKLCRKSETFLVMARAEIAVIGHGLMAGHARFPG